MNLNIKGEQYKLHFGMKAIEGVLMDIGAGDDFTKASEIMQGASKQPMLMLKVALACAYHGIEGHCRLEKTENPFANLDELSDSVSNIGEITPAIEPFTTAFIEFFKLGGEETKGSKKKASHLASQG